MDCTSESGDSGVSQRELLCGMGEEILLLVSQASPTQLLTNWLNLCAGDIPIWSLVPNRNECCTLRRHGEELLSVVMDRATPGQWVKWLQIPLEQARLGGKKTLVDTLIAAGADANPAIGDVGSSSCADSTGFFCAPMTGGAGAGAGATTTRGACSSSFGSAACPDGGAGKRTGRCGGGDGARSRETQRSSDCTRPSSSCYGGSSSSVPQPSHPTAAAASSGFPSTGKEVASILPHPSVGFEEMGSTPPAQAVPAFPPPNANAGAGDYVAAALGADDDAAAANNLPLPEAATAAALVDEKLSLHRAAIAGDVNRMRELLVHGRVDKNATDLWSCTALHRAAEQDGDESARLLIAAGLDVGARDMEGYSPLHFAAARSASKCIVHLLQAGAQVSLRGNNGDTPLHSAVRFLSLSTARLLLQWDADETARNEDGHTPADVTGVLPDGRDIEDAPDPLAAAAIIAELEAAPAYRRFRIWKRRAWLVMLRARAQARLVQLQKAAAVRVEAGTCAVVPKSVGKGAGEAGASGAVGNPAGANGGVVEKQRTMRCGMAGGARERRWRPEQDALVRAVKRTVALPEEGVFQKIVLYL
ncbi:unnamed protein product [Sphacelaria rigidula]